MSQESLNTRHTLLQKICNQHDEKSWEEFVYYYENYIYMVCLGIQLKHHDAEEVKQLVLVKLWKKLPEFKYDKNKRFRSWLCRVTRNTTMDYFRSKKRRENYLEKAYQSEHWAYYRDDSLPEMEQMADREWKNYVVRLALDNLRSKVSQKMVDVFLQLEKGYSAQQVGAELRLPRNTVYIYQKRMQRKLGEEIRRLSIELGD